MPETAPGPRAGRAYMPDLTEEEEAGLRESIRVHGVLQDVLTDEQGIIIDGHNRARIAGELGVPYETRTVSGLSPEARTDLAFSQNMAKRNLGTQQKREIIRRYLEERPEATDRGAARVLGVHHQTVGSVRAEMHSVAGNGENIHRPPAGVLASPFAQPELPGRQELSGRNARGRKPDSPEERERKAAQKAGSERNAQKARVNEQPPPGDADKAPASWREAQEARWPESPLGNFDRIKHDVDAALAGVQRIADDPGWDDAGLPGADTARARPDRLYTSVILLIRAAGAVRAVYRRGTVQRSGAGAR